MDKQSPVIRYDVLIQDALRGVVAKVLATVVEDGLLGEHHFYITFETAYPGVSIPAFLLARYPDQMTIVLQNQFYDLTVTPELFSVALYFNGRKEVLTIPLKAIRGFADPSVDIAFQFHRPEDMEMPLEDAEEEEEDNVISFEDYKKKK